MRHLPIDIVWFHALEKFSATAASRLRVRLLAVAGVFVACTIAAAFASLCIEAPARKIMPAFWFKPAASKAFLGRRLSSAR